MHIHIHFHAYWSSHNVSTRTYTPRPSIARALRQYGFPHVWPSDLWDAGAVLVPADRLLVPSASVEDPFDEYAAWQLFARCMFYVSV